MHVDNSYSSKGGIIFKENEVTSNACNVTFHFFLQETFKVCFTISMGKFV